jgi:Na+-transporting methylmalonyl-CoA/oxaloacetate decarboxylase gamma subunit
MHLLASATPPPQGFEDILSRFLPYQALGLALVLFALTALFWICALAGWFFGSRARTTPPTDSKAPAPAAQPPAPPPAPAEDPRLLAAIAAAVAVALENHAHNIVEIAPAANLAPMTSAWAIEGRFQHFSSHKFR